MKIAQPIRHCSLLVLTAMAVSLVGCNGDPMDEAKQAGKTKADYPTHRGDEFEGLDWRPSVETEIRNIEGKDKTAAVRSPAIAVDPKPQAKPDPSQDNPSQDNPSQDNGNGKKKAKLAHSFSEEQIMGRNSWVMWTGGNQAFWDHLATHSNGLVDLLKILDNRHTAREDRFRIMGLIPTPGMRAPNGTKKDQAIIKNKFHGLNLDIPIGRTPLSTGRTSPNYDVYGYETGIVGLRLWENPAFDPDSGDWDPERFIHDPDYAASPTLVRPFRVGMACGFCHVSYNPLNPPEDTSDPKWENLSATIGSQYFKMRGIFGPYLEANNTIWQLFNTYRPGTIDTSLIATDGNNNPNTMNAIFGILPRIEVAARTLHEESVGGAADIGTLNGLAIPKNVVESLAPEYVRTLVGLDIVKDGKLNFPENPRITPRILAAGEDSIGALGALARVYVNIGEFHQQWLTNHTSMVGLNPQNPFSIEKANKNSVYWQVSEHRAHNIARYFLTSSAPMRLEDARWTEPGSVSDTEANKAGQIIHSGKELINYKLLKQGALVFAEKCFVCHSSKQPDDFEEEFWKNPTDYEGWVNNAEYIAAARKKVLEDGFRDNNYFSTDQRYPVTLIGTHSGRAWNDNSVGGRVWDNFSSQDFKRLRKENPVTSIVVDHPYEDRKYRWEVPRDNPENPLLYGPGYYRPHSLIGMWATAPFLHNNSVGDFPTKKDLLKDEPIDVTAKGRIAVYDDAIDKLLNPEKRHGRASIARTTQDSALHVEYSTLREVISRVSGYNTLFLFRGYPYLIAFLLFVWGAAIIQWGRGERERAFQILGISHGIGGVVLLVLSIFNAMGTDFWWLRWFGWMDCCVDWLYGRTGYGSQSAGSDWFPAFVLFLLSFLYFRAADDPDAAIRRLTIKFVILAVIFYFWGLQFLAALSVVGVIFMAIARTDPMRGYKILGVLLGFVGVWLEFFYDSPLAIFGAVEHIVAGLFIGLGLFLVLYGSMQIEDVTKWVGRGVSVLALIVLVLGAKLERDGLTIGRIPAGTPVNLLINLNAPGTVNEKEKLATLVEVAKDLITVQKKELPTLNHPAVPRLVPNLLKINKCPDFVIDRGHTFGSELSDSDKAALKEYLKTL